MKKLYLPFFLSLLLSLSIFAQMTVEDKDSNILMEVSDEGTVGSIVLPDTNAAPTITFNKLYNLDGTLNWNGSPLATGGSVGGWTVNNNNVYSNVTGNVGIGTSNPQFKLHMKSISQYPVTMGVEWIQPVIGGGGASDWFYYLVGGRELLQGGINMIRKSGNVLRFSIKDQISSGYFLEQMRLTSEGYLGVGTTTPKQKLHIFNQTSGYNKPVAIFESESNTRIDIRGPGTDKFPGIQFSDPEDSWKGGFYLNETNNSLEFYTSLSGSSPRMVIVPGGNVGINEVSPGAKLDVNGDINVQKNLVVTGAYKGNIGPNNGAPFPRPAYDSGQRAVSPGQTITLTHSIGGDPDNYFVVLWFYGSRGRNISDLGGDDDDFDDFGGQRGGHWSNLTASQIKIYRGDSSSDNQNFRVRIWVYN